MKFEWEVLSPSTCRAKVYGGWLIRHSGIYGESMVFVPDLHHSWILETT